MLKTGKIISVVLLGIASLAGVVVGNLNRVQSFEEARKVEQSKILLAHSDTTENSERLISGLKTGGLLQIIGGILCLGLAVSLFLKKPLILGFGLAVASFAVVTVFLTPSLKNGVTDPRLKAIFYAVPAISGSIFAYLHFFAWKRFHRYH